MTGTIVKRVSGSVISITGQAQGDILYYNGTAWVVLAAGTADRVLKTAGAGANPGWGLAEDLEIASQAAGDVLFFNGTNWVRLAKGTANQRLSMNAGATAPEWQTVAAGSGNTLTITQAITSTDINTTSTTVADITNATLSATPVAEETWLIIVDFHGRDLEESAGATVRGGITIDYDGTEKKRAAFTSSNAANGNTVGHNAVEATVVHLETGVTAASHTVKARWAAKDTNHTLECNSATTTDRCQITLIRIA